MTRRSSAPGEQVAACTLELRAAAYLPIRSFTDLDVDGERAAQADPVLGILSALGDLPPGWRGLSQLVLQPRPRTGAATTCGWRSSIRWSTSECSARPRRRRRCWRSSARCSGIAVDRCCSAIAWLRSGQWLQLGGLVAGAAGRPGRRRSAGLRRLSQPTRLRHGPGARKSHARRVPRRAAPGRLRAGPASPPRLVRPSSIAWRPRIGATTWPPPTASSPGRCDRARSEPRCARPCRLRSRQCRS